MKPIKIEPIEETVEEKPPIPKLKVVGGDGELRNPNWLQEMNMYSVFLCKDKHRVGQPLERQIDLREYHVLQQRQKTTQLKMKLPGAKSVKLWVDTLAFSLAMDLVEVLDGREK